METVRKLVPILPLLALVLSGCSTKHLQIPLLSDTPTPVTTHARPTAATMAPPQVLANGYDHFAGNCIDAANEDIALIGFAASQNYNLDMQLRIKPITGCDADPKSAAFKSFIRQVGEADLLVSDLDGQLVFGYTATRETFISNLFAQLQAHYPSLGKATITTTRGGRLYTVLTYTGHGQPVMTEDYGQYQQ